MPQTTSESGSEGHWIDELATWDSWLADRLAMQAWRDEFSAWEFDEDLEVSENMMSWNSESDDSSSDDDNEYLERRWSDYLSDNDSDNNSDRYPSDDEESICSPSNDEDEAYDPQEAYMMIPANHFPGWVRHVWPADESDDDETAEWENDWSEIPLRTSAGWGEGIRYGAW